jgi:hypothetical protein
LGQAVHIHLHSLDKTLVRTTSSAGSFDKIVDNKSFSKKGENILFSSENPFSLKIQSIGNINIPLEGLEV